ncbi:hypothetical protein TNIN_91 [Trichonephila inaurata madagascariensis]|uniref:Uncharacterized protein n=1 Tax=Trichonephila inaurata madagascariensis TaxID=2747483 RepID=A0A8X7C391_9ARAC|nr:hypothetical protein TNIN_91 [Trichonephila inaurata madagascariensis]
MGQRNDTLPSLPEPDIERKNLKSENVETGESSSEARIQDDAVSVSNIESNYRPEVILNDIFTAARANIPSVTRLARHRVPEDLFYRSNRRRYQRNRWQEWKKRVLMHTRKIRNSQNCLYVLIPLLGLPVSAIVFSLIYIMECRKITIGLVLLNGILGFLLIICRIFTLSIKHFFTSLRGKEPKVVTKLLFLGLIVLFFSGMMFFYEIPPVFDPSSEEYCAENFCTYHHFMNIAVSCILSIAAILHIPEYI